MRRARRRRDPGHEAGKGDVPRGPRPTGQRADRPEHRGKQPGPATSSRAGRPKRTTRGECARPDRRCRGLALVAEWAEGLAYLTGARGLALETIRAARLGWTPGVATPKKNSDGWYLARGVVIPWFDEDRSSLVKVRQPEGARPKHADAFRDRPSLYPGTHVIRVGRPLVIAEGEFDAILVGQELAGVAVAVTLGSASGQLDADILGAMFPESSWYAATDSDAAVERAAGKWPARARRVRPPAVFKDWTEARHGGIDLWRW